MNNNMLEHKGQYSRRLNNKQEYSNKLIQSTHSIQQRASMHSHTSSSLSQQIYQKKDSNSSSYINILNQPPRSNPIPTDSFQEGQIHRRLHITQQQSQIEQLAQMDNDSINYENLEQYNQEISQMPYSITPLVYSKNSKKGEVRFRKDTAKIIILKIRLAQAKEVIQKLKQQFLDFSFRVRQQHESLLNQISSKYFQLLGEYSLRVQQSVFNHKQDYQQLKFELSMIKAKEILQQPIESNIMAESNKSTDTLQIENENLKNQINGLNQQKQKLSRQAESFKKKMAEKQVKTLQIRQSNDKLYEYIFDLQQKIAFYKEQIPKITQKISEENNITLEKLMSSTKNKYEEEVNKMLLQIQMLQEQNGKFNLELTQSKECLMSFEKQNEQLKLKLEKIQEQKKMSCDRFKKQIRQLQGQNNKLKSQIQRINKEKQQMLYRQQKRQQSSRLTRAYSIKQDKKALEALEIQKIVLQKENIQLKATIQFINKNQPLIPHYATHTNYPSPYENPSSQRNQQLQMKERQLLMLQNYLEDEARKLQTKQREIQSDYLLKKTHEVKYSIPQNRHPSNDDYGMVKNIAVSNKVPQRKNHLYSSQAQAIIQKVKMRQKMKQNGCNCIDTRNCRCEVYSRGSRTSVQSNPRQYLKLQTYRPSNCSPYQNDYVRREQKNSKMKLIEQKVRRLKSQLKNSFSTMNN